MFMALLIWIILLLPAAIYLYHHIISQTTFRRLINKIPGPPDYPLIGTVLDVLQVDRQNLFRYFHERTMKYGPIFRTWSGSNPEVHISKPEHMEIIMGSTTLTEKSRFYKMAEVWLGQGLLTSNGAKWHSRRKIITPTFHFKILETFVDVFEANSKILLEKLRHKADSETFDIYPYISRCTLDIICETAMGTSVYAQEQNDSQYISAVYEISYLFQQRFIRPWLAWDAVYKRTKNGKRFYECLSILHGFTKQVIRERKILRLNTKNEEYDDSEQYFGKKRKLAFLDLLLEVSDNGEKLTESDLREEVDTFMFEGHDTTSAGICWTLFLLGNYPNIQGQIVDELNEIFQGSDRPATMSDLQGMKCLERTIKESLRLYPSVPFINRKLLKDVEIDGYKIPSGCVVSLHLYHVNRDKTEWKNPEVFNPDNFLPENIQGRHPYAYVPFSGGQRNCIGQKFALLEEKTVISRILRKYTIESIQKENEIKLVGELILRPASGVLIKLKTR